MARRTGWQTLKASIFIAFAVLALVMAINSTATAQTVPGPTPFLLTDEVTMIGGLDTSFDPTPVPFAPVGTYAISGTGLNVSDLVLTNLAVVVIDISGGNVVFGCDSGAPQGAGCIIPIPPDALGPDGLLFPGETFSAGATVGLVASLPFSAAFVLQGAVAVPESLVINPVAVPPVPVGESQQLQVIANFPGGSTLDVTNGSLTTYVSSDPGLATVDENGLVTGVSQGSTQLIIGNSGVELLVPVQVDRGPPSLIKIQQGEVKIRRVGETEQLQVFGEFIGSPDVDITSQDSGTTYLSSDPSIVTVDENGLITGTGVGSTEVTIDNTGVELVVPVEVQLEPPVILNVIPNPLPPLLLGDTLQLQVLGDFQGNLGVILTNDPGTTYLSSDPAIVSVDENGLITGVGLGSADVTIDNTGVELVVPVQVELGPPVLLIVEPSPLPPLFIGDTQQLIVTAAFADGTTQDATSGAEGTVYTPVDSGVVTVDPDGFVTVVGPGETTIVVDNNGVFIVVPVDAQLIDIGGGPPVGS